MPLPYLDSRVYRELARSKQISCFYTSARLRERRVEEEEEPASSPGSEACDSKPGLLTLTERKSGGWCSPLLPCSGVLCLRAAWLGPFSELGNLRTVSDLSSLSPSSSDELLSRGFGGSGGGAPGLRVELKRQKLARRWFSGRRTAVGDAALKASVPLTAPRLRRRLRGERRGPCGGHTAQSELHGGKIFVSNLSLETKTEAWQIIFNKIFFHAQAKT